MKTTVPSKCSKPIGEAPSLCMRNIDVLSKLFGPFLEMMAMAYDEVYEMLMDELIEEVVYENNAFE